MQILSSQEGSREQADPCAYSCEIPGTLFRHESVRWQIAGRGSYSPPMRSHRLFVLTLSVCALSFAAHCSAQATAGAESATPSFRQSHVARPIPYTLNLVLDPTQPAFQGNASISIELKQPTKTIWLNQKDLTVRKVAFRSGGGPARSASFVTPDEFLGITFPHELPAGPITLEIAWDGLLNDRKSISPFRRQTAT